MPSKIRVLDEHTINKIAAGEVIENPASVVKELVENAIDAGSSEICVEIKGGGRQLIRITDDGCGMSRDDALLCLERHATSKIREIEDIHTLTTMGFRGEAVPSIASISKLSLLTCQETDQIGTLILVDGGRIIDCSPAARAPGTTFEVKSLFYNVPVRRKFQRSPAYDTTEIVKIVSVQALAHPLIKFQLISNQSAILSTKAPDGENPIGQIEDRVGDVLGTEFSAGLLPVERSYRGYKLMGFIGLPSQSRQNRTGQYLFINQRAVVSPLISYAARDAYGTTLGTNRHPVFVLYLTLDGSLVDVNVHPQKREVRLREEGKLREFITLAIEEALQGSGGLCTFPSTAFYEPPPFTYTNEGDQPFSWPQEPFRQIESSSQMVTESLPWERAASEQKPLFLSQKSDPMRLSVPNKSLAASSCKVLAALQGYLVLFSKEEKLYLLDQRSAHSRILYEQILDQKENKIAVQQLLIPLTIELAPLESALLKSHLEYVNALGIQIEEFGNNTFIVHGIPHLFTEDRTEDILSEIVNDMKEYQNENIVDIEVQKNISKAAGRAAVSTTKTLSLAEGECLYQSLMKCRVPYLCPHGKPTIVELKQEEIAKQFQIL